MENIITEIRGSEGDGPIEIEEVDGRLYLHIPTEAGYDFARVDLIDTLSWVKKNRPELLEET